MSVRKVQKLARHVQFKVALCTTASILYSSLQGKGSFPRSRI